MEFQFFVHSGWEPDTKIQVIDLRRDLSDKNIQVIDLRRDLSDRNIQVMDLRSDLSDINIPLSCYSQHVKQAILN